MATKQSKKINQTSRNRISSDDFYEKNTMSGGSRIKTERLQYEASLIIGLALLVFWLIALLTYSASDPAWSTSGLPRQEQAVRSLSLENQAAHDNANSLTRKTGSAGASSNEVPLQTQMRQSLVATHNWAGKVGALVADVCYFFVGFSVIWLWLAAGVVWLRTLRAWLKIGDLQAELVRVSKAAIPPKGLTRYHVPVAPVENVLYQPKIITFRLVLGALLLLMTSTALEWTRFYRWDHYLPSKQSGGALGQFLGERAQTLLGFTGSGLVLVCLFCVALALTFGFSWTSLAEKIGKIIKDGYDRYKLHKEQEQDFLLGRQAMQARHKKTREEVLRDQLKNESTTKQQAQNIPEQENHWNERESPVSFAEEVRKYKAQAERDALVPRETSLNVKNNKKDVIEKDNEPKNTVNIPKTMEGERTEPTWYATTLHASKVDASQAQNVQAIKESSQIDESIARGEPGFETESPSTGYTGLVIDEATANEDVTHSTRALRERQQALFVDADLDSQLPHLDLLDPAPAAQPAEGIDKDMLEMTSRLIEKKLKDFGVEVRVVYATPGPVVTRYEIEPATGVKGSQIVNLAKDLARSLSLVSIRVIETIPGKNLMALELPNVKRQSIRLIEILGSQTYNDAKSLLTIGLGKDISGHAVVADLAKMPHVLVAGTTGSGKSVGINAMVLSLLYKAEPEDVRMLMIDPKMLEMSVYEGIPHLIAPVVTDMRQAANGLNWCVAEMERRYKLMSKMGVRNLAGFNQKIQEAKQRDTFIYNPFSLTPDSPEPLQKLPYIVVVIDELADLMMVVGKKIEELIARLAQKARAAGIHLVLATQRPSVDVITGLIKANIPTRIAFQVSSKVDSRTILDQMGAEALLGMGDMLYLPSGTGLPIRVHGAFVSDDEVHRVVNYLKSLGPADYIDAVLESENTDAENGDFVGAGSGGEADPLYDQAVAIVLKHNKASISLVQRILKIGYGRSANLLDQMEQAGLVGSMSASGKREVLAPRGDNF